VVAVVEAGMAAEVDSTVLMVELAEQASTKLKL
jgi:hypothetical protein